MEDRHIRNGFDLPATAMACPNWLRWSLSNGVLDSRDGLEMRAIARSHTEPEFDLSIPLWPRASERDQKRDRHSRNMSYHRRLQARVRPAPHGAEWKKAMRACGAEPLRLHSVDRTGLARRQRRFILLDCPDEGVERKCRITAREFNRVRRGQEFWCRNCGLHLDRESAIEKEG